MNRAKEVVNEINSHIIKHGGTFKDWYIGIASDPKERLFTDHNVREQSDAWIYCSLNNDSHARIVEKHFIDRGCKGGPGGGSSDTRYIYAYRITASTVE